MWKHRRRRQSCSGSVGQIQKHCGSHARIWPCGQWYSGNQSERRVNKVTAEVDEREISFGILFSKLHNDVTVGKGMLIPVFRDLEFICWPRPAVDVAVKLSIANVVGCQSAAMK